MNDKVKRVMAENGYYGSIDDKPDTEKELFYLQEELFEKRDAYDKAIAEWIKDSSKEKPKDLSTEPWSKMLSIVYSYASSLVKKGTKGKKYIDPDEISDKALEAAFKFMSAYNRKPDFAIGASFAGNLRWKVVEVTHEDKLISLNQPTSYDAQAELLDTLSENDITHVGGIHNTMISPEEMLIKEDGDIIGEIFDELDHEIGKDSKLAFLARLYVLINLRVPRTRHIKRLFLENWAQEYRVEQVLESTMLEIYNRYGSMISHVEEEKDKSDSDKKQKEQEKTDKENEEDNEDFDELEDDVQDETFGYNVDNDYDYEENFMDELTFDDDSYL